jgi:CHAP domain-containing protein
MSPRPTAIRRALATASAITAIAPMMLFISATSASATTTSDIASLALANTGKGAGWCSQSNSSNNSLGGNAFGSSCDNSSGTGNGEYWCADFAKWVWQNANGGTINTSGLTPGAGSFYTYGSNNGTLHTSSSYVPQAGDAVVYDYQGSGVADHVGLVTAVNSDGSVQTANGDWGGSSGVSQAYFAETSSVVTVTLAPSERSVGSVPSGIGMTISGYITPVGLTSGSTRHDLYQKHSDGSIWKYTGTPLSGWTQIGTNAAAVFVDAIPGGGVVELDNTGTIWEYVNSAWTKIDNNAATTAVQVGDDGAIYEFHNDGSIWVYDGVPISGWTELDNNAAATGMAAGDSRAVHK